MATYLYPPVSVTTIPPTGGASASNQLLEIADLDAIKISDASIDTKMSTLITATGSLTETAPASDTASSGLNGRLQRIAQRLTSLIALFPTTLGQGTMATSMKVVLPSDQSAIAVSLPAGASTSALQTAEAVLIGAVTETAPATDTASSGLNGRLQRIAQRLTSLIAIFPATLGSLAAASSLATTSSTEDVARIGIITETAPASDTASSGLNGRLQRIAQRITSLIALLPAALGQGTMATSFKVVIASDQSNLNIKTVGKSQANAPVRNDYTVTSVTTAAYVQLVAATTSASTEIEIFDSSGQTLFLATGAAASEVNQVIVFPGGNGRIPLAIAAGTRVSIKAISATASIGEIDINFYN